MEKTKKHTHKHKDKKGKLQSFPNFRNNQFGFLSCNRWSRAWSRSNHKTKIPSINKVRQNLKLMEKRDEENFAVDAIVATSEPQVPKPRTKKPEAEKKKKKKKKNEKKNCSLEVGKTNAELPGDTCQRSSQTLIHSPVVKADRCRLSHPPPLVCVRWRLQLRVFVRLARWRCGCTPRLIPFFSGAPTSPPNLVFFFYFSHFFQNFHFLSRGSYLRLSLHIYLFIYLLYSIPWWRIVQTCFWQIHSPNDNLII